MNWPWQKALSFGLLAAVLVLLVMGWKVNVKGVNDQAEEQEYTPVARQTRAEKPGGVRYARNKTSLLTSELRKEALELLGELKEFEANIKMVETEARLSAIFRQWGKIDFEEAKQFLESEELAKKMQSPDRHFADDLLLAALIGYSKTDPIHAWDLFLTTQIYTDERPLILNNSYQSYPHNVVAEEIMRDLFRKSDAIALKTLREIDPEYGFLVAPSLRAILSESNNVRSSTELFKEFFGSSPKADTAHTGFVCSGLAERDSRVAWKLLRGVAGQTISDMDPEIFLGYEFIANWSRRQPEEALRFVAEFGTEEGQDTLLLGLITSQRQYRPELIVEAMEMDIFKRLHEKFLPDVFVSTMDAEVSWPLIDENVPLPREDCFERLKKAVESSELPDSLKQKFLLAIEANRMK